MTKSNRTIPNRVYRNFIYPKLRKNRAENLRSTSPLPAVTASLLAKVDWLAKFGVKCTVEEVAYPGAVADLGFFQLEGPAGILG